MKSLFTIFSIFKSYVLVLFIDLNSFIVLNSYGFGKSFLVLFEDFEAGEVHRVGSFF